MRDPPWFVTASGRRDSSDSKPPHRYDSLASELVRLADTFISSLFFLSILSGEVAIGAHNGSYIGLLLGLNGA